jgi:hypothetical protein
MPVALTNLVRIERARSRAGSCAYERAFLSGSEASDACACDRCSGYREFVTVLLPESSAVATTMTPGLRRPDRGQREHQHQSYQKAC